MGAYNDNILLIHIPKTGGWALKTWMRQHLPGMLLPDNPASKLPIGHVRLQDIERFTGRKPENFELILAVIRDPYEQQLSQWCFWRDRYARGGRHIHDCVAASYPTLEGFLRDPRCDFHVWYEQHYGYQPGMDPQQQEAVRVTDQPAPVGVNSYEDFGGYYRYWITVDDEIPTNLQLLRFDHLQAHFQETIEGYRLQATDVELPHLNRSSHPAPTREYYTPLAAKIVEAKFRWAFENYYDKWLYSSLTTHHSPLTTDQ